MSHNPRRQRRIRHPRGLCNRIRSCIRSCSRRRRRRLLLGRGLRQRRRRAGRSAGSDGGSMSGSLPRRILIHITLRVRDRGEVGRGDNARDPPIRAVHDGLDITPLTWVSTPHATLLRLREPNPPILMIKNHIRGAQKTRPQYRHLPLRRPHIEHARRAAVREGDVVLLPVHEIPHRDADRGAVFPAEAECEFRVRGLGQFARHVGRPGGGGGGVLEDAGGGVDGACDVRGQTDVLHAGDEEGVGDGVGGEDVEFFAAAGFVVVRGAQGYGGELDGHEGFSWITAGWRAHDGDAAQWGLEFGFVDGAEEEGAGAGVYRNVR